MRQRVNRAKKGFLESYGMSQNMCFHRMWMLRSGKDNGYIHTVCAIRRKSNNAIKCSGLIFRDSKCAAET